MSGQWKPARRAHSSGCTRGIESNATLAFFGPFCMLGQAARLLHSRGRIEKGPPVSNFGHNTIEVLARNGVNAFSTVANRTAQRIAGGQRSDGEAG